MRTHAALLLLLLAGTAAAAAAPPALSRRALLQASPGAAAAPGAVGPPAPAPAPEPSSAELPTLEWPLSGREWAMFVLAGLAMFVMAGAGVGEALLRCGRVRIAGPTCSRRSDSYDSMAAAVGGAVAARAVLLHSQVPGTANRWRPLPCAAGGGMLLIPIFQLVGGMNITYAVALSSLVRRRFPCCCWLCRGSAQGLPPSRA